jgi:hypothetical protein
LHVGRAPHRIARALLLLRPPLCSNCLLWLLLLLLLLAVWLPGRGRLPQPCSYWA